MSNALMYSPSSWLDQFFNDFDNAGTRPNHFHPSVDIVEDKEEYVLRAELPGVSRENLKLEVKENRLSLSGKKDAPFALPAAEGRDAYRYTETVYGSFSRAFELPRGVQGESIKAEFKDGVLTLRIPKAKEILPRTIAIE